MSYWGSGSTLGLLTCLGYFAFVLGAVFLWRSRREFSLWVENELFLFRRRFSRYVAIGPFYGPRTESRIWLVPSSFVHSMTRLSQRRFTWAAFLLCLGLTLFFLDFFV
jgi:hypothetical protein